ncbi:MAG: CBS domain-containing protein [Bryobacterales bacterium]
MEKIPVASGIMATNLHTLSPSTNVIDGVSRLLENRVTGAPVVDADYNYKGIFSEKCSMDVLIGAARLYEQRNRVLPTVAASDIMQTDLVTLHPEDDAFEAIAKLLDNRISGAPVVDANKRFIGSFSEKTSMSVLLGAAYDQLPTTTVANFMNVDPGRMIEENLDWMSVAKIFLETPYRRLPVVRNGRLLGQISRRDVLRSALHIAKRAPEYLEPVRNPINSALPHTVGEAMDSTPRTIRPDLDLLTIATIFRDSPYRRLAVVQDGKLLGLVSRRDLLCAVRELLKTAPKHGRVPLYLSAILDEEPATVTR